MPQIDDSNQREQFPGFGQCIYCGEKDVLLSDEHIMPLNFWGKKFQRKQVVAPALKLLTFLKLVWPETYFGALRVEG